MESSCTNISKHSSTDDGSFKEETFLEALTSQVDEDNVNEIINCQKKSLERFEKTNEMLRTSCLLAERRLEKAKTDYIENKELILQAKSDLESIFRRIRHFKTVLSAKYPDIYQRQLELLKNLSADSANLED